MRVLLVVEKEGTAIDRLAKMMIRHAPHHAFRIVAVHPKRPTKEALDAFEAGKNWADVIDYRYWKTAQMLESMFDISKPKLLTHYNPYDLQQDSWTRYQKNIVVNSEQQAKMRLPTERIDLPVDLDFWEYEDNDAERPYDIIMVANRIEAKKGILPVAQAAKENGWSMVLVGNISDPNYHQQVMNTGAVTFRQNISDEELQLLYHQSKIHICNSVDGYESGTMPILEAMASGTLVVSRKLGHVPDVFNGRNMIMRHGQPDDTEDLSRAIKRVMEDDTARREMRSEARDSLRYRNCEIYARNYSKLYHQLHQKKELVTAIVPTVAKPEQLIKTLSHIMSQTYGPMEIIVVDDGPEPGLNAQVIEQIRAETHHTIKFLTSATYEIQPSPGLGNQWIKTYGIARARNQAIMEAEGKWLWFVDDRMLPDQESLQLFYERRNHDLWLYGVKDGVEKSFVENFSFVHRHNLALIGSFNERITQYGGTTQEVRTRWERNGKKTQIVTTAKATVERRSSSRVKRHKAIAKSKTQCYKLYG